MKGANISPKNDYEGELRGAYTSPIWVRKRVGRRICPVYMLITKELHILHLLGIIAKRSQEVHITSPNCCCYLGGDSRHYLSVIVTGGEQKCGLTCLLYSGTQLCKLLSSHWHSFLWKSPYLCPQPVTPVRTWSILPSHQESPPPDGEL